MLNKMTTSPIQFDILISFMEKYGDLIKPPKYVMSRVQLIRNWMELTTLLNKDPNGEKKSADKWKRVWSDLKKKTKHTVAKLQETGSYTTWKALAANLTDIERRVLIIMKNQIDFVDIVEDNDSQKTMIIENLDMASNSSPPRPPPPLVLLPDKQTVNTFVDYEDIPLPVECDQAESPRQVDVSTPPTSPVQSDSFVPANQGHIPKRRNYNAVLRKLARNRLLTKSNYRFINFLMAKVRADDEMEKERLRLREIELNLQKQWQEVATKKIEALHKIIDRKFHKE